MDNESIITKTLINEVLNMHPIDMVSYDTIMSNLAQRFEESYWTLNTKELSIANFVQILESELSNWEELWKSNQQLSTMLWLSTAYLMYIQFGPLIQRINP